jgi:hypothetical protein
MHSFFLSVLLLLVVLLCSLLAFFAQQEIVNSEQPTALALDKETGIRDCWEYLK